MSGGYCPEHVKATARQYDDNRGTTVERGYGAVHRRLRVLCFVRDGWRCVDCGWEPDVIRETRTYGLDLPPATVVLAELRERYACGNRTLHADHQIPITKRPDLKADLDNLRTRCNACHRAKTMREADGG